MVTIVVDFMVHHHPLAGLKLLSRFLWLIKGLFLLGLQMLLVLLVAK